MYPTEDQAGFPNRQARMNPSFSRQELELLQPSRGPRDGPSSLPERDGVHRRRDRIGILVLRGELTPTMRKDRSSGSDPPPRSTDPGHEFVQGQLLVAG